MTFTADNNFRFTDKGEDSFLGDFIAGKDKHVSIFLEDLVLSFDDGRYVGAYELPF